MCTFVKSIEVNYQTEHKFICFCCFKPLCLSVVQVDSIKNIGKKFYMSNFVNKYTFEIIIVFYTKSHSLEINYEYLLTVIHLKLSLFAIQNLILLKLITSIC